MKKILKYIIYVLFVTFIYFLFIETYVYKTHQNSFILNDVNLSVKDRYINSVDVNGETIQKRMSFGYKAHKYDLKDNEHIYVKFIGDDDIDFHIIGNIRKSDFSIDDINKFKMDIPSYKKIDNKYCSIYYSEQRSQDDLFYYLLIYIEGKNLLLTVESSNKNILLESIDSLCGG